MSPEGFREQVREGELPAKGNGRYLEQGCGLEHGCGCGMQTAVPDGHQNNWRRGETSEEKCRGTSPKGERKASRAGLSVVRSRALMSVVRQER
jgi:hypothetical protein